MRATHPHLAFIQAIEQAPGDPGPVNAYHDWLEEHCGPTELANALRWSLSRELYPLRRDDHPRWPWVWFHDGEPRMSEAMKQLRGRHAHAVLPRVLFAVEVEQEIQRPGDSDGWEGYRCWFDAMNALALRLRGLRDVIAIRQVRQR